MHQALCLVFYIHIVYFSQPATVMMLFLFSRGGNCGSSHLGTYSQVSPLTGNSTKTEPISVMLGFYYSI